MKKVGIILIAGMGTRLKPYTETTHKCLTQVNGTPIIHNALNKLSNVGVSEVILVVGYLKDQIKGDIGESYNKMEIRYVANDIYKDTNTSHSLLLGLKELDKINDYTELYVLEGDVFFSSDVIKCLTDAVDENVTILEPYNEKLSGTFVEVTEKNEVLNWTRENRRPEGYTLPDKYKTVNLYKFSKIYVDTALTPATETIDAESEGRESMETVMNEVTRKYLPVNAGILHGEKWFEIDDEKDLHEAEKIFAI